MASYKMICMKSFAARLSWAMKCAGLEPTKDQSRLAAAIGKPCKPQNIQHLLDPNNEVSTTKYLLDICKVLGCDPFWLGKGDGVKPELPLQPAERQKYRYDPRAHPTMLLATNNAATHYLWPFKSFSFEEYNSLDETIKQSAENLIVASIRNRGHPPQHDAPASFKASA